MAISTAERRFLRGWEEQRKGGKGNYVATYTFAYTLVIFLSSVALALFLNIPFIRKTWLISLAAGSVAGAFVLSNVMWSRFQKKWRDIIDREVAASN